MSYEITKGAVIVRLKLIYKKSLAMELIRLGHDLEYTAKNRSNEKYQVYFFKDSEELAKDICKITGSKYVEEKLVD